MLTVMRQRFPMVVRTRFRSLFIPFAFYALSSLVAGYFIWHAMNGQRGLKMRDEYTQRVAELQKTLNGLRAERASWITRIDLVRGENIDRDVLEEQTRTELGRIGKNEVVILIPNETPVPK